MKTKLRRYICSIGLIFTIGVLGSAAFYDVPTTGQGEWVEVERGQKEAGLLWVEEKDYSSVPWWVKVGKEYGVITLVFSAAFLYGTLKN